MIIVISVYSKNKQGYTELIASHGIDEETGKIVILPQEHPAKLGAKFDCSIGEYVIDDEK